MSDELWQSVYRAREDLWSAELGPMPEKVHKLMSLTGVWPGGCLVQLPLAGLGGLWLSSSFGLTNPDMPASSTLERHEVESGPEGTRWTSTIVAREPRAIPPGRAGYGYEIAVVTPDAEAWPLQLLGWAVESEILHDVEMVERVDEIGAVSIEAIGLGEGRRSDFLVADAPPPLPGAFSLPNGEARLLVAIAIHRDETRFALEHGQMALLERIASSGMGPVSTLGRPSLV